jgi:hypothetical protein
MAALVEEFPPATEPLSLQLVKNELKVPQSVTTEDLNIGLKITAARETIERMTGRILINTGFRQSLDSFPYFTDSTMSQQAYPPAYYSLPRYSTTLWNYSQMVKLLRSPLQAITKITFSDSVTGNIDAIYPALFSWLPLTEYVISEEIEDPNGNLQVITAVTGADENGTSLSGSTQPTWSQIIGGQTTDGMLTWTCMGPVPDSGDFIYDADSMPPRLFPLAGQFWPPVLYVPNAVQIHFIAGYGSAQYGASGCAIPRGLLLLMLQLISHWHFNREPVTPGTVAKVPMHLESMIWHWKIADYAATRG